MKMYQLNCPACGATVEIEQDRKSMFCSYCGSKIYLDDGVKRVEITKNINYHQTYTDEAKIREHERKEKIQLKQLEYEEREKKRNDRVVFICIGILFLIAAICFGISRFYEEAGKPDVNEVQVPFSSKDLKGENYEQVIIDLENAGFIEITTKENKDLVTGFITKDGSVEKVSINGDSDFEEGDIFPEEAAVVVTYHTFEDKD